MAVKRKYEKISLAVFHQILNPMNHLFTYISATKNDATSTFLTEHRVTDTSYSDEDLKVCGKESIFSFSNGVQLKKTEEFDDIQDSELVCPECWISYEVIDQPVNLQVTPRKKVFTNICQEAFWLKVCEKQSC